MSNEPESIDITHPTANMFGVQPCPRCTSIFRWPTPRQTIHCDDCGLDVPVRDAQDDRKEE
jgi:hypothetical protein